MSNHLQLKITLRGSRKPPIWRQVLVPLDINFYQLHAIIQGAMGWYDGHLHAFKDQYNGIEIGIPFDDGFSDTIDGSKVKISKYLTRKGDQMLYEYDFGDGWEHLIEVQKVVPAEKGDKVPHLIKGKGACPPEDCGGIHGYYYMVEAINDPQNDEHEEMAEWAGTDEWDLNDFDLNAMQQRTKRYFDNAKGTNGTARFFG